MKRLIKLANALSSLHLHSHAASIKKIAGEEDANYLDSINFKAWVKDKSPPEGVDKKEFWSNIQKEFKSRKGGGPLFDDQTLDLIRKFDSSRLPKKESKRFIKWLAYWIRDWNELSVANQNMILDWWSATGAVEEGRAFDEKMIEMLDPQFALRRAEDYHDDSDFYFDPTENYLTPPDQNVIYDFGDGYKIVYVPGEGDIDPYPFSEEEMKQLKIKHNDTSHDRVVEGNKMGICLGKKMRLYQDNSDGFIYSLRNSKNEPCVTIRASDEIQYNEDGEEEGSLFVVHEALGRGNSIPSKQYADYILKFFREPGDYDGTDFDDIETQNLTRMNSKDPAERKAAVRMALGSYRPISSNIFSIDWKTIKEEMPEEFNKMILSAIFLDKGAVDYLDSSKLGGDEAKIELIKSSWKDYPNLNPLKQILLSSGNKYLFEIVPESFKLLTINKLIELFNFSHSIQQFNENDALRNRVWKDLVRKEIVSVSNIYDLETLVDMFYQNIYQDGGKTPAAKHIVKVFLNETTGAEQRKTFRKIQDIIPDALEGEEIRGDNYEIICLPDSIQRKVIEKQIKEFYGLSPFDVFKELKDSGYKMESEISSNLNIILSNEQIKEIFSNSKLDSIGTPQQLYALQRKCPSYDILPKEFWKRNVKEQMSNLPLDDEGLAAWIICADIFAKELIEPFFEMLKEDKALFMVAIRTYLLDDILSHEQYLNLIAHYRT